MATVKPFLGPHAGNMRIFVYKGPVSINVGGGSFTEVTDFTARFSGSYDYLVKGQVNVAVELKDHNPQATSGPCSITIMDNTDDNARYQVEGNNLMVITRLNKDPLKVYPYKKGTEFDYPTLPAPVGSIGIWIGP